MRDLDELIVTSLREGADTDVDAQALLAGAVGRGRTQVRRRRISLGLGFAMVVAMTVGAITAGPRLWPGMNADDQRWDLAAPSPGWRDPAALPGAPGVPGAADRPDLVGTDPGLLHFDAPTLTANAEHRRWTSADGYEQIEAGINGRIVYAAISANMSLLDAAPRQGAQRQGFVLREQPVPGLWLRVDAPSQQIARQVARTVDLGHAQRCALPFQLSTLPAAARVTSCSVSFGRHTYSSGGVLISRSHDGATMEVQAGHDPQSTSRKQPNYTITGKPAYLYPARDELELTNLPGLTPSARIGKDYRGFTVPDAAAVLGGLTSTSTIDQVQAWPIALLKR
ncbi:hypothetical protein [Micromonospora ureilytica]|uniref:hypothetical protein n=1 Tax=Micromonospora ureilytica TaxID=709868 RepID=UPI004038FF86